MIKIILFNVAFGLSAFTPCQPVFALIAGPAKVVGTVVSFNEKSVLVENEVSKYDVPKEFVAEKNLKAGNKIEITLSQEQADKVKIEKKASAKK